MCFGKTVFRGYYGGNRVVNKKDKGEKFITGALIAVFIVTLLIISGSLANALMVTLSADKTNVTAGAGGGAGNITFTTWVNLSDPDAYVPIQRIYLNLSGPLPRSFSFDTSGGNIQGMNPAVPNEITVVANPSDGFGSSNYGFGFGYGYGSDTGLTYDFGYGFGYGSASGAGASPLNVSYQITLNTTNMYDGNYTATTNVYAAGSSTSHGFASTSSVAFEILPRIFTVTIREIGANISDSSEIIYTPVGNFSYTIVAGPNDTSAVTLNVTVQVSPPPDVSTQVNSTATGGLGAGAIPSLYFNYSVDDPTWYDNISYIHMRMYYNESDLPSNVAESTLRAARYLTNATSGTGWVKLDCGTCPRTLEIVTDSDDQNRSVILRASGVDISSNYVWANVTHYSTFGIAGTVTTSQSPSGGGSSGGGGGGGGGGSAENYSNILVKEKYELYIFKDKPTSYRFTNGSNPVIYVKITGNISAGAITTSVEVLKNTSALVKTPAPGLVYMNVNIWVGTSGFAVPKNIKSATIGFKVDNSWLTANGLSSSDVKLLKWDGSQWIQLETTQNEKSDAFTFFEGKTTSFSPFAISAKVSEITSGQKPEVTQPGTPPTETTKPPSTSTWTYLFIALAIVLIVIIAVTMNFLKKKKDNDE
jgi:PGF-pre-PGF domain-containing protein